MGAKLKRRPNPLSPHLVRRTLHGVHVNGQLLSDGDAAVIA
jgi:hypothetical protein